MAILTKDIDLWSKWDSVALKRKRAEIGEREFSRGWRQRAISEDDMLIQPAHIDACKDYDGELLWPGDEQCKVYSQGKWQVFMGVDLAIAGTEKGGDYFCLMAIAVERPSFKRKIIGMHHSRGLTFKSQLEVVEQWDEAFNPTLVCVENVAYQDAFVQEIHRTTSTSSSSVASGVSAVISTDSSSTAFSAASSVTTMSIFAGSSLLQSSS